MSEDYTKRFLLYSASAAAAAAAIYASVRFLLPWLLPFLFAVVLAGAAEPIILTLRRRFHFRRSFSALLVTLTLLFLAGGLLSLLGTTLLSQAYALLEHVPSLLERLPLALRGLLDRAGQSGAFPLWLRERIESSLTRDTAQISELLGSAALRLLALLGDWAARLPRAVLAIATGVLAFYFTAASYGGLRAAAHCLPQRVQRMLRLLRSGAARSFSHWLRAELTLCAITFSELLLAFFLMRQRYALLLALLITLLDALPVFGVGTVLVPWAAVSLLFGNVPRAAALAATHLITLIVRSTLEPHLLGRSDGVPPLFSLAAMYFGFCAFGIGGMLLFPFLLLFAAQLWKQSDQSEKKATA